MRRLVLSTIFCLGFAWAAAADPIPLSPELRAFMMRPEQQQAIVDLMAQQWRIAIDDCSSPKLLGENIVIVTPPAFDASGTPVSGDWRIVGRVEACGAIRIFSVEYLFAQDGQMKRVGTLPGTTFADLRLQRDALLYASMAMIGKKPKDCDDTQYLDTKFVKFADENSTLTVTKRPWMEEWTVRACGVTGIVTMHFIPNATGTTIMATPDETRAMSP